MIANFEEHIEYHFEYLFSICITCLILRIAVILQFNEKIGPLIKIVGKLSTDFFNFFIIYIILVVMFTIIGNISFMADLDIFEGFFHSFLTVIDASLGNYSFSEVQKISTNGMKIFGNIYLISLVLIFNILLLNFIIAILSNTYNIFDNRSNGLYLSKILSSRDELNYDQYYGAFLSAMPPINIIQLPFIPFAIYYSHHLDLLRSKNRILMQVQYSIFMIIFFVQFIVISFILIPFAWVIGIVDKIKSLTPQMPTR